MKSDVHALGLERCPTQTSTQFFKLDSRPGRGPCPGRARPFAPGAPGRHRRQHRRRPHAVRPRSSAANDGDQNLTGLNGHDAARLPRDAARASPTARRRRSTRLAGAALHRAAPSWPLPPARRRARSARATPAPAPARTRSTSPGKRLPRRPLQRRAAEPRGRRAGGLRARMTSATSSSGSAV